MVQMTTTIQISVDITRRDGGSLDDLQATRAVARLSERVAGFLTDDPIVASAGRFSARFAAETSPA